MSVKVDYSIVEERDMDTLFLEALASDSGFMSLFTSKIEILKNKDFKVLSIQLSKSDSHGESDITVIIEVDQKKYGLLIEDKINAGAMEEQCNRYTIRGEKGKNNKDYEQFFVFIVCPKKYYETNSEAKKYPNHVSYEECKAYLQTKTDILSDIWVQQISQALAKLEKHFNGNHDFKRVKFLEEYVEYQKNNFSKTLSIATNPDNAHAAGWVRFNVPLKNAYILHKSEKGCMDLTFSNQNENEAQLQLFAEKLAKMGYENLAVEFTGKSMAFRLEVPVLNFDNDFDEYRNTKELNDCFEAAGKLTEIAKLIQLFGALTK